MGAKPSREADADSKTFHAESTPVSFSSGLIDHLSDQSADGDGPSQKRQTTLDSHIHSKIAAELDRLRAEEAQVSAQVQKALEKENLEKEAQNPGLSTADLESELEEIKRKVERQRVKREGLQDKVQDARESVVACYLKNKGRPLECWMEVQQFQQIVAGVEKEFVQSVR